MRPIWPQLVWELYVIPPGRVSRDRRFKKKMFFWQRNEAKP